MTNVIRFLDPHRRARRPTTPLPMPNLPEPTAAPTPPPPPPPGAPEQRWTRAQLEADRANNAWTPGRTPRGPDALTPAELAHDRRVNANSWRIRKGVFAPQPPTDKHPE